MIRRCLVSIVSISLLAAAGAWCAEGSPSAAEAEAAMKSFLGKRNPKALKTLHVRAVHGCFPALGRGAADHVCLIEVTKSDGSGEFITTELPFRLSSSSWNLLDPEESLDPACPGVAEAQRSFRKIKKNDGLVVTEGDEEGILSDERGKLTMVKGPWRLRCVYSVKSKLGEHTYVTYIRRENGAYVFDPEIEDWGD
ncbi:MAG TPA: hypothetical protein VGX68_28480 [Thermoanaerobaculia bacterium]|nr:hypothetical protein [Thermoanaerobaculia bacterium]